MFVQACLPVIPGGVETRVMLQSYRFGQPERLAIGHGTRRALLRFVTRVLSGRQLTGDERAALGACLHVPVQASTIVTFSGWTHWSPLRRRHQRLGAPRRAHPARTRQAPGAAQVSAGRQAVSASGRARRDRWSPAIASVLRWCECRQVATRTDAGSSSPLHVLQPRIRLAVATTSREPHSRYRPDHGGDRHDGAGRVPGGGQQPRPDRCR